MARRRVRTGLVPAPALARRLATAARWPVGVGLTSWSYMWRTTPMHRREETGFPADDAPPTARRRQPRRGPARRRGHRTALPPPIRRAHPRAEALARGPHRARRRRPQQGRADRVRGLPEGGRRRRRHARRRRVRRADGGAVGRPGPSGAAAAALVPLRHARRSSRGRPDRVPRRASATGARFEIESWARSGDRYRTSSTTACAWPRRSSCTCGPRSSSALRRSRAVA